MLRLAQTERSRPHHAVSGRDVLQRSERRLLGEVPDAARHQRQVHAHRDGAPQPLDAVRVRLLLQQGALSLQVLGDERNRSARRQIREGED